jgi:type II secretory pathway pseudopilin PulG
MDWHYAVGDEAKGPVAEDELKGLLGSGRLPQDTLVWRAGLPEWTPASLHPELVGGTPPGALGALAGPPAPASPEELFARPWPLTLLCVLWGIGAALWLLLAAFVAVGLVVEIADGDMEDVPVLAASLLFLGGMGALLLAAAVGTWRLRPWGRTCGIVVAVLGLFGFPFGTIVSALVLAYLLSPGVRALLSGRPLERLDAPGRRALEGLASSGLGTAMAVVALVVLAFSLLILPAIAIPNLLEAIQRGKQKRTAADMRTVATALEAWSIDHGGYPPTNGWTGIEALREQLEPSYVDDLPTVDGWNGPLFYRSEGSAYQLVSAGRDGVLEDPLPRAPVTTHGGDIVIDTGEAVAWPPGVPGGPGGPCGPGGPGGPNAD